MRTRHARGNIKAFSLRLPIARNFERQIVETNDSVFVAPSKETKEDNVAHPRSVRRNASDNAYARLANPDRLSLKLDTIVSNKHYDELLRRKGRCVDREHFALFYIKSIRSVVFGTRQWEQYKLS